MIREFVIQLPNLLSLTRLLLCAPLAILFLMGNVAGALFCFILAAITDLLDGFIAKRFNATTSLGSYLDPLADKSLVTTALVALTTKEYCPMWFLGIMLFTTAVQATGLLIVRSPEFISASAFTPLRIGKWATAMLFIWIGVMLFDLAMPTFQIPALSRSCVYAFFTSIQLLVLSRYIYRSRAIAKEFFDKLLHQISPESK